MMIALCTVVVENENSHVDKFYCTGRSLLLEQHYGDSGVQLFFISTAEATYS